MTVSTSTINVRPIAGCIGAEIDGVDLREALSPAAVATIRQALLKWKVVFFRNQDITQAQHVAFGRQFGDVVPGHPTLKPAFPDYPEILLADNSSAHSGADLEMLWHTDVSYVASPPMASILRGVIVPPYGGDTQWTNLVAAFEDLSPQVQRLCEELHAVHRNQLIQTRGETDGATKAEFESKVLQTVHPVVRVHPETGEKAIFVNPGFTTHIVELTHKEGAHVLRLLFEQLSNHRYTCRFRWQPHSIAFWDNRTTCHIVPTDVPSGQRRSLQRITLAGDVPVGVDGGHS